MPPGAPSLYTARMAKTPSDPRNRPVFLVLHRIRFPVGAVASFLHRLSGLLLVVAVPGGLGLAEYSTRSAGHFRWVAELLAAPAAAAIGAVVLAGLVHHLLAGVRVILMDMGVGVRLAPARGSAWGSLVIAAGTGLLALWGFWPGSEAGHGP